MTDQLDRLEAKLDAIAETAPIMGGPLDGCRITKRPDGVWAIPDGYVIRVPAGADDIAMVWNRGGA